MPQRLDEIAKEESSYVIEAVFRDRAGTLMAPNTATWTLTDENGTVINSRQDVSISSPTNTEEILLSGDDLQILSGETEEHVNRLFTIEAVYNSDLGNDLPLRDAAIFLLENLASIT